VRAHGDPTSAAARQSVIDAITPWLDVAGAAKFLDFP